MCFYFVSFVDIKICNTCPVITRNVNNLPDNLSQQQMPWASHCSGDEANTQWWSYSDHCICNVRTHTELRVRLPRNTWWRHQMETFSALLALCVGNSPVTGEFPAQRPVTRSFDASFDLRLNKRLHKQSWGRWFETPSRSLWRHRNDLCIVSAKQCNVEMGLL